MSVRTNQPATGQWVAQRRGSVLDAKIGGLRRKISAFKSVASQASVSGPGSKHFKDATVHRNHAAITDRVLLGARLRFAPCVVDMKLGSFCDGMPDARRIDYFKAVGDAKFFPDCHASVPRMLRNAPCSVQAGTKQHNPTS